MTDVLILNFGDQDICRTESEQKSEESYGICVYLEGLLGFSFIACTDQQQPEAVEYADFN